MGLGLGQIAVDISRVGQQNPEHIADIIEFVSSPWGLHFDGQEGRPRLFPVQNVILKAHYGLELDDTVKFKIWKDWRLKDQWEFTEKEYLEFLFNEGRSNIKEVDHNRREMVLVIGRRSGKCILGDSLVLTNRGLVRIDTLGDPEGQEVQPLDVLVAQEGGQKAHSKFFYNGGTRHTRTLTTRCGYQLGGTDNHRIKVLTEQGIIDWKYLADLKVGDVVCLLRGTNLWGTDKTFTEEQGLILGHKVGKFSDVQIVPQSILCSPKSVVQAFLQGLFDSAEVGAFNWQLAHEVQILLLNLGVASRISSGVGGHWTLSVDSDWQQTPQSSYFFDPVVGIEEGINPVFDLNVPDGESFVANGLVNHNTFLAAAISAYETYKLLMKGSPQRYYGLPPGNQIGIVSVATDKDQAGILYNEVSAHYRGCQFFKEYTANNTQSYARFQTPADIEETCRYAEDPGAARATVKVSFKSCIAKGLRGPGNLVIIMDEAAHFTDNGQSSAEAVYNAITPSTATFSPKDKQDSRITVGDVEGRIINISSPLARQGQFYKLYQIGMKGTTASDTMLVVQAPTWEVNPTVPASEYEKHYLKDPVIFYTEFGAQFSDRARGWIEREQDLLDCIDVDLRPAVQPPARRPHFMGVDVGLVGDGSAVAIGHLENRGDQKVVVLDLVEQIKAGEGAYKEKERLDFTDVVDWIHGLSRKFYIAHGMCDQWAGIPFEQALQKKGLLQIKSEHMTRDLKSDIFRNFKDMMYDHRLVLYDWPIDPNGSSPHCDYIQELLELQAETHSKYVITVEAPQMEGKHDDRSDALVRMVWLACQNISSPKYISGVRTGGVASLHTQIGASRRAFIQARQMGTSPDRQRSRVMPGRTRGRY